MAGTDPQGAAAAQGAVALDFVTVIFRPEAQMLRLQARSMARFLDPASVNSILVVLNDEDEAACRAAIEPLRPDWGPLAEKVRIVPGSSLLRRRPQGVPAALERAWVAGPRCAWRHWRDRGLGRPRAVYGWARNNGWLMQQAFKLLAVEEASGSHVVILDAKNFFIRPTDASEFVDPEGRPRVEVSDPSPKMHLWAHASAAKLGQTLPEGIPIPPALTPVVHRREEMARAVELIAGKLGCLECFFARRSENATEFMLLFVAMGGGRPGWSDRFAPRDTPPVLRVEGGTTLGGAIETAQSGDFALMSLHRRNFFTLTPEERAGFADWLCALGLLSRPEEMEDLLAA
ncbi:DUF6492 family protein [Celeribacter indicus]|uniref:Uncharacterized protein n=2 Tax=Celeribacter indicus TaxID=1208324 RepID=A0A0B5E3Z2_9RHOB|nr:DUF6492 family protein [Celeribacter indicus]AJE48085.1 hypothetical protein P73_3370 [Celeribacter indicus]